MQVSVIPSSQPFVEFVAIRRPPSCQFVEFVAARRRHAYQFVEFVAARRCRIGPVPAANDDDLRPLRHYPHLALPACAGCARILCYPTNQT